VGASVGEGNVGQNQEWKFLADDGALEYTEIASGPVFQRGERETNLTWKTQKSCSPEQTERGKECKGRDREHPESPSMGKLGEGSCRAKQKLNSWKEALRKNRKDWWHGQYTEGTDSGEGKGPTVGSFSQRDQWRYQKGGIRSGKPVNRQRHFDQQERCPQDSQRYWTGCTQIRTTCGDPNHRKGSALTKKEKT